MKLKEIYDYLLKYPLEIKLQGDGNAIIDHIATLQDAHKGSITFLANRKYKPYLETAQASAVILNIEDSCHYSGNALIVDNVHLAWAYTTQLFNTLPDKAVKGVHSSAVIAKSAIIDESAMIGPNVVIEDYVVIGAETFIGPGSVIESGVQIGKHCHIHANVTICYNCILHDNVMLHSGAVIGAEGFGFARGPSGYVKVAQIGRVILNSYVDIGANTCIDRGAVNDTVIGEGCKIDNHVQIGHNCVIGMHTVISGHTGIAGSATIGNYVVIGGGVGINGHISIADHVVVTGFSMITHSLTEPGIYSSGMPITSNKQWLRNTIQLQNIDKLYARVKKLEKKLLDSNV